MKMKMNHKIIEHEPMISTTYGTFPQSQASRLIAEAKAREAEARKKEEEEKAARPQLKCCPFSNGMSRTCRGEHCALFNNYACALVTGAAVTENRLCPFGCGYAHCGPSCALYVDGHCVMGRK